jgi:hypothetical protein
MSVGYWGNRMINYTSEHGYAQQETKAQAFFFMLPSTNIDILFGKKTLQPLD